ncbi:MAG: hypothetical protein ACRDHY_08510, partial [Anaerolineales bacterium]
MRLCLALLGAGCTGGDRGSSDVGGAGASDSSPWFRDVALESGIDFVHESGARGDYQLPEIMGSGCAWLDHDQDGDLDAFLVNAGSDPALA